MRKNVAVLLAAYNGEDWLEEQVASILEQDEVDVTVYVSLDKSSDKSREIIERLSTVHKNVIFLREGKFGSAGKNFYGILKDSNIPMGCDYYCFADQDDIWLKEKLCQAIALMERTVSSGYSSNVTAFWSDGRKKLIKKSYPQKKWDFLFEAAGPGCTYVLDRKLFQEFVKFVTISPIPVETFEAHDWLIYAYARSKNYQWIIDEKSLMLYRQHQNNQVGANNGLRAYVKRFKQVFSGDWFSRVENLVNILSLGEMKPAIFLMKKESVSYLKLSMMSMELRRKKVESIYLSFFFLIHAFKKWMKKND